MGNFTATYSPEDNKLRLYATTRLDAELYARVKSAGFIWAPKQELFVAPAWTPEREDLLLDLCGEIGDEDTSLVERAEERAERFEDYSEKRGEEAESARAGVSAIADNIPLGQPILVGHHSERHARKDAERIENGMRKAVKLWETSKYWQCRAEGALRHAKYKEKPEVRARRIKGLEADKRKQERNKADAEKTIKLWSNLHEPDSLKRKDGTPTTFQERARFIAGRTNTTSMEVYLGLDKGTITPEEAQERTLKMAHGSIARAERWIAHLDNRILYEKTMLDEQGATSLLDKKPRPKQLPLCNYRQEVISCENVYHRGEFINYPQIEMTAAEYAAIPNDYKGTRVVDNSHRIRVCMRKMSLNCVFLTDSKVHDKPEPQAKLDRREEEPPALSEHRYHAPERTAFDDLKEQLKAGVQVVSAPQLFPTPPTLAAQMVEMADIEPQHRVLEPSAGTGNILRAIGPQPDKVAVEINSQLVSALIRQGHSGLRIHEGDFLEQNGNLGTFDRIVMNPPFHNAEDIKHILHARKFLNPNGKLVAICANGPRQQAQLRPFADTWEELPEETFSEQGTNVRTVLLTMQA